MPAVKPNVNGSTRLVATHNGHRAAKTKADGDEMVSRAESVHMSLIIDNEATKRERPARKLDALWKIAGL